VIQDTSVRRFLDSLADRSATPGGGSATALLGAIGAALVSMVCQLTLEKDGSGELKPQMQAVLERARVAQERLTLLLDEDVRAFSAVMAAYALPRANAEETRARSEAIQAALHAATLVPLACARESGEVMELSRIAAEKGHLHAIGEAGVAALAAHAALRGAALNVSLNAGSIKDQKFVETTLSELEQIVRRYGRLDASVQELLDGRLK
jgi:methenyltetrahydrofolate cyclohydrolase